MYICIVQIKMDENDPAENGLNIRLGALNLPAISPQTNKAGRGMKLLLIRGVDAGW